MKKELKVGPMLFPMPVLMIATYGENNKVDVMNMAWGGIFDTDKVILNLTTTHKTVANIKLNSAFSLSIADRDHIKEADFFGIASGNNMSDKFEKSVLKAVKSEKVNAPIIEEFPLTLECKLEKINDEGGTSHIIGKIVHIVVDEKVLNEKGQVDVNKMKPLIFNQYDNTYWIANECVGKAWSEGKSML